MEFWSPRQRRWFPIAVAVSLLGIGAIGGGVLALAAVVVAPFAAAVCSGRSLPHTIGAGAGVLFGLQLVYYSLSPAELTLLVGGAAAFVLPWEDAAQVCARLAVTVLAGGYVWVYFGGEWGSSSALTVSILVLLGFGLVGEVVDFCVEDRVSVEILPHLSVARKTALAALGCFGLSIPTFWLGPGYGLASLLMTVSLVAGLAGSIAAFATEPAEGEARAATLAMSMTPILAMVGYVAFVAWAMSSSEWSFP